MRLELKLHFPAERSSLSAAALRQLPVAEPFVVIVLATDVIAH